MNILALSPHTDDAELGAGGTIARYIDEGARVHVVALGTGGPNGATRDEFVGSISSLGVERWILLDYPSRSYHLHRQDILDELEALRDVIQPNLVLIPSTADLHQDHRTVTTEAMRAFKYSASLWGYELPTNYVSQPFSPTRFVRLERWHVDAKIEALRHYKSQWQQAHRDRYMRGDCVTALLDVRGLQIKVDYAEAFEIIREIR